MKFKVLHRWEILTESENKKLVREIFDVMKNDIDELEKYLADDISFWTADYVLQGKDQIIPVWISFFKEQMKPKELKILNLIAQGNHVAAEAVARATHIGEWGGVPATGKEVTWNMVYIFEFEDGKVKSWKDYFNIEGYTDKQTELFLRA